MHPAFQRLVSRVRPMGNVTRKYLRAVERYGPLLVGRLEAAGTLSNIHLDRTSPAVAEDFERVAAAGRDPDERLVLLGTFYGVQYLHQNARALEQLAIDLTEDPDRLRSYEAFLNRAEEQFSLLVTTYVRHVLKVVMKPDTGPFSLLIVGTRGHQDDIDVAVIDLKGENRADLDRAMGRLATQCLRFASPLDNYLAGQVGAHGFCMSVEEIRAALHSGRLGCVVVTELLRAELLAGEPDLLRRLHDEVTSEYFFNPPGDNSRHELYLRGLLGETRSLLLRPPPPDRVNPKDDGLRMILGLVTALSTIEGVGASGQGNLFDDLIAWRPRLARPLSRLRKSRIFLETFRLALHLLVAPEEDLAVEGESARENLSALAAALGYRNWGPVHAISHLLVHYDEAVEAARSVATTLMEEVARHLTANGPFSRWATATHRDEFAMELAEKLLEASRGFYNVRFYDDLLEAFSAPDGALLEAFVRSFARPGEREREELALLYADWGCDAPYAFLSILNLVAARRGRGRPVDIAGEMADAFLLRLSQIPEAIRALSRVFRSYPALANRFLFTLGPERLDRLHAHCDVSIGDPEVAAARDGFQALMRVQRQSSHYILRVLARVTERHPATVEAVSDDTTLKTLALGRLAASERHPNAEEQKGLLGDFYDIEFLRIAMGTLRGEADAKARAAFSELTATYLDRLFDFCFRQADREARGTVPQRERLAILLSGGNARRRPYDEDYDLLALIDSRAPGDRDFAERVVVLMNRQIARRGVVAQYRLGEHFRHFVTTLDELVELLSSDGDELFVDRCQLIGSKIVVGSRKIEEEIEARVLQPLVFSKSDRFVARVAHEIAARRGEFHPMAKGMVHLKDTPGGLREIDLALAISAARLGLWDSTQANPFPELSRRDPAHTSLYEALERINDFLVSVRSAYRVAVAATDEIERSRLDGPAKALGYAGEAADAAHRLFADIDSRLAESAALVDRLVAG